MKKLVWIAAMVMIGAPAWAQMHDAKEDVKGAAKSTAHATKKAGHKVAKGVKKGAHATAKETRKGAAKVEDKTD